MIKEALIRFYNENTIEEVKNAFFNYLKEINLMNPFGIIFDFTNILEVVYYDKNIDFACDMYDVLVPEFKTIVTDFLGGNHI